MKKIFYLLVYASNAQFLDSRNLCSTNQFCNETDNLEMSANCASSGLSCINCPKGFENLKQKPEDYRCTVQNSISGDSGISSNLYLSLIFESRRLHYLIFFIYKIKLT